MIIEFFKVKMKNRILWNVIEFTLNQELRLGLYKLGSIKSQEQQISDKAKNEFRIVLVLVFHWKFSNATKLSLRLNKLEAVAVQ